jgi:hypothetical protein
MAVCVRVLDEVNPGTKDAGWELELPHARITARELIRSRVYQEVTEYNARTSGAFRGLVQPTDAERVLNGYRLRAGRRIDWQAQYEKALEAFTRNGFLLLVDDHQLTELDEEVELRSGSEVTFLRLLPLVGG